MFGGLPNPPTKPIQPYRRPKLAETDIFMPSPATDFTDNKAIFAHRGREPKTDFAEKLNNYKRRHAELHGTVFLAKELVRMKTEETNIHHTARRDLKRIQFNIKQRLKIKLDQVENDVERRRHRLANLLAAEEQIYIKETLDIAQQGDTTKFQRMRKKRNDLIDESETARRKYIHEQRIKQYASRCQELRPIIAQKNLMQTKSCQLQQMRENQSRREHEKEIDNLWIDMVKRKDEAQLEREKQDALLRHNRNIEYKDNLKKQVEGKKLMIAEEKKTAEENYKEIMKEREKLVLEQNEAKMKAKLKIEQNARQVFDQLEIRRKFVAQRKIEETALEEAFTRLCELEIKKEQAKISDTKVQEKRETKLYLEYLQDLKNKRKINDIKLNALLQNYQIEVRKQQAKIICDEQEKKRIMSEQCVRQLAEQVKAKKLEAKERLEQQLNESEVLSDILKTNKELDRESARIQKNVTAQYRHDLEKQIEYNKLLKDRERIEMERQLTQGMVEERKYTNIVNNLILMEKHGNLSYQKKHAFRHVLEQYDCHCPNDNTKS